MKEVLDMLVDVKSDIKKIKIEHKSRLDSIDTNLDVHMAQTKLIKQVVDHNKTINDEKLESASRVWNTSYLILLSKAVGISGIIMLILNYIANK